MSRPVSRMFDVAQLEKVGRVGDSLPALRISLAVGGKPWALADILWTFCEPHVRRQPPGRRMRRLLLDLFELRRPYG